MNSENVASEKKKNSLKLSGDRLHAVTRDQLLLLYNSTARRASAIAGRASAKELATEQETRQLT